MEDGKDFKLYMPGASLASVSGESYAWISVNSDIFDTVPEGLFILINQSTNESFCGYTDTFWNHRYDCGTDPTPVEFMPQSMSYSSLLFWGEEGPALDLAVFWDGTDREKLVCNENWSDEKSKYEVSIKKVKGDSSKNMVYKISVKALDGYDFSTWGGTADGEFEGEFTYVQ